MSAAPGQPPLVERAPGIAVPLLNPRDDAARLIAAMARERQPLTLAELAPRAGIPVAEARRALGRLERLQLLDGNPADGWTLRRAAAESAPELTVGARALAYLRHEPDVWTSTRDIELAIDSCSSQVLNALSSLLHIGEIERRKAHPRGYEWRAVPAP